MNFTQSQLAKDFEKNVKEIAETESLKRKIAELEKKIADLEVLIHSK